MGTCSGFGYAVLEMGQAISGLNVVHHPNEGLQLRSEEAFLQPLNVCNVGMHTIRFKPVQSTLTCSLYGETQMISEESHCNYGINRPMIDMFEKEGLIVSGYDNEGEPKIMEYIHNHYFVITLFLPQLKVGLKSPHPLLTAFFNTVKRNK